MLKLLLSVFKRLITAVTSPFRMMIVRFQRLFNINILTAKLIPLLTKKVRALITLKPQSQKDYFSVGRYWVYKKLMLTVVFVNIPEHVKIIKEKSQNIQILTTSHLRPIIELADNIITIHKKVNPINL